MTLTMLKKSDKLKTTDDKRITVIEFIGDGGQGEVYRVEFGGSKEYALKWYYPQNATADQLEILKILVRIGPPDQRFLWPMAIVLDTSKTNAFGYIMPFRPPNYKAATGLLNRKIEPTFYALLTACYELSESFFRLHAKGLAYRDISISNIFIEPETGHILICDNDNVAYESVKYSGVSGTPKYMAPEIVRNESLPNRLSDLYSLSVLLFFMMYIAHPLDGKREASIRAFDEAAQRKLYGIDPLYIFHPTDKSNEPEPEFHANALAFHNVLPKVLNDTFERAFVVGLEQPAQRVEETLWRALFVKLRDQIVICSKCGTEVFYDFSIIKSGKPLNCWSCNEVIAIPARMRINNDVIILNKNTKLYAHHTEGISYNFSDVTAEISEHPVLKIPGLKNLSPDVWYITKPDQSIIQIPPKRSFALESGFSVKFGLIKAEIKV